MRFKKFMKKFNNILILRTDRIGDVVLTIPTIKALRTAYPMAKISILVSNATIDLVRGNPYLDEILIDDSSDRHKGIFGFWRLVGDLRRKNFDIVFVFHTKRRTNLACFLAGVPVRVGYCNNKYGFLLNRPIKDVRHHGLKHETELCLDALRFMGVQVKETKILIPVQKEAEIWALDWMSQNGLHPGQLIAIHPGASDPTRCWPVASFANLITGLVNRYSFKVVLIGGKDSIPLGNEILRLSPPGVLNLIGQTNVAATSSVLRRCFLLVSNNSGPMHIASGLGIYVIALFLHTQLGINAKRWGPLPPKGFVLINKLGEEITFGRKGKYLGGKLDSISVEEVLDLVENIFSKDQQNVFHW